MIYNEDYWKEEQMHRGSVAISTGLSWVRMAPLLAAAEEDFLRPLLGDVVMDEVIGIFENLLPPDRTEAESSVLRLARRAELNLALWANFDTLSVRISDQGFQRQESDSWRPAYKYQEDNLRRGFANAGFNSLDRLIDYLETHLDEFPKFAGSPAYTISQRSIVRNTADVQDIYDINNSRLVFLRLRPLLHQVEELCLQPVLGNKLYDALRAWLEDGETALDGETYPDDKWEQLRDRCRKVVVMTAIVQLLRTTGSVTDRGVYFRQTSSAGGGNESISPVADNRLQLLLADADRAREGYVGRLTSWVKTHMATHAAGDPHQVLHRDNDDGAAFWA